MPSSDSNVFLIWGGRGWIAGHLRDMLREQGKTVHTTTARMEDRMAVLEEIRKYQPTRVLNCAGCTGRPNVDWCEDNKQETLRSNAIGTMTLADVCWHEGVHMTNFATGCIYHYDEEHPIGGTAFVETDPANFSGSYYSATKALTESLIHMTYPSVLTLRLRMPVSDDLHPRNFVTKITKYEYVVNIPNSNSILHDLLPLAIAMSEHEDTGVFNFTNGGAISHNEVLERFKQYVRPDFEWKNFSLEQQSKILKAGRSNCELDNTKLLLKAKEYGIPLPDIHTAYDECFQRMAKLERQAMAGSA